jgi:hypothetical protein
MDAACADEVEDEREAAGEASDVDAVAGDVFGEAEFLGAEGEHRGEGLLGEDPAGVDFPEEEQEVSVQRVGALQVEVGAVQQFGVGEVREVHAPSGTTHFFDGRKGPACARRACGSDSPPSSRIARKRSGTACAQHAFAVQAAVARLEAHQFLSSPPATSVELDPRNSPTLLREVRSASARSGEARSRRCWSSFATAPGTSQHRPPQSPQCSTTAPDLQRPRMCRIAVG